MKGRALLTLAIIALVLAAGLAAQAAGCRGEHCAYLAAMPVDAPPAPTPAGPTPGGLINGCEIAPPDPAEGLQVWWGNYSPIGYQYSRMLCYRLAVNGRYVVYQLEGTAVVHRSVVDEVYYLQSNQSQPISFIAQDDVVGDEIFVDVAVPYLDRVYVARTSFIARQPPPTLTPEPTITNTPTATATPTLTPTP